MYVWGKKLRGCMIPTGLYQTVVWRVYVLSQMKRLPNEGSLSHKCGYRARSANFHSCSWVEWISRRSLTGFNP